MIKKPYKKYIGKVCLYKKILDKDYKRIEVLDIKDQIIKYKTKNETLYSDLSKFDNSIFLISPMDNKSNEK